MGEFNIKYKLEAYKDYMCAFSGSPEALLVSSNQSVLVYGV